MARLRLKQLAEAQGLTMSQVQRRSGLTMTMIRRYWYNTASGKAEGAPLEEVRLSALDTLAHLLGVAVGDLFESNQQTMKNDTQTTSEQRDYS